jgi:phosphate transport system permease protein
MTMTLTPPPERPGKPRTKRKRTRPVRTSLLSHGEPMIWTTGGALAIAAVMIVGLVTLVLVQGIGTFWPRAVVQITLRDGGKVMGEVTRDELFTPGPELLNTLQGAAADAARQEMAANDGQLHRRLVRIGNYELTGDHFRWVSAYEVASEGTPPWAIVVERMSWGRFYGMPKAFKVDGQVAVEGADAAWARFEQEHASARDRFHQRRSQEVHEIGEINSRMESARLRVKDAELNVGKQSEAFAKAQARFDQIKKQGDTEFEEVRARIAQLNQENARYRLVFDTAQNREVELEVGEIVRAYPANQVSDSLAARFGVYVSRWWEFLAGEPREANSEGGVFPAIFGTVLMTLIMCMLVVPFGVLAALYLREYAKAGPIITAVRIAINNLAGVPSIVFGVFGLGFFCYIVGGGIDSLFFSAKLSEGNPTFGKGALIWASFTLALLTLPVVIVATEEALAAVPNSMREGSYACGASKWQTIKRIVLPRAMPGVMTGAILAMARGAGEVAPLMLVGAVKLAPELPFSVSPAEQFGANRSFMHLGFHIYDLGFQSQNSEAAKPMVFTTTLLLIVIIALLNITAITLRSRLRRRFFASQF